MSNELVRLEKSLIKLPKPPVSEFWRTLENISARSGKRKYFALGDLAMELFNRGYNPIGTYAFLSGKGEEILASYAPFYTRLRSGVYVINGLPITTETDGRGVKTIDVLNEFGAGQQFSVPADIRVFQPFKLKSAN